MVFFFKSIHPPFQKMLIYTLETFPSLLDFPNLFGNFFLLFFFGRLFSLGDSPFFGPFFFGGIFSASFFPI